MAQARKYVAYSQGDIFNIAIVIDFEKMFDESIPMTPLICFLSMGSDPTPTIEGLAKRFRIEYNVMSMGQGQEVHARKLMLEALKNVCTTPIVLDEDCFNKIMHFYFL